MFIDRSKLNDYTIDFGDTRVIWHHFTPLIVPDNFTLKQERYLLASLQTLFCGNTSVDNILKSQLADYENAAKADLKKHKNNIHLRKRELISKTLKDAKKLYNSIYDTLETVDFTKGTEASSVCEMIFIRLHSSFKACRFLIKYGYYFETYAIQRQILEQLAFAFHVSNSKTFEDFIDPPRCIREFKDFYSTAGTYYGTLCKRTHIDKTQIKLVRIRDDNDNVNTILNSLDFSLETLYDFAKLLDIYCCTFEYCFRNYIDKKSLLFINGKDKIKSKRPSKTLGENYRKQYKQVLEESYGPA